ncbi:hypothetical protein QYF36_016939 [Acer negundo]|nr:hypothetical protein QYF36_016939 [Acer negundo]
MIKNFLATVYHCWIERHNRIFKHAQISNQRTEKQIKLDVKQRFSGYEARLNPEYCLSVQPETGSVFCLL